MEYVGIDLGKVASQVCIEDAEGTVTLERRIKTTRENFSAPFGTSTPQGTRIQAARVSPPTNAGR